MLLIACLPMWRHNFWKSKEGVQHLRTLKEDGATLSKRKRFMTQSWQTSVLTLPVCPYFCSLMVKKRKHYKHIIDG